MAESVLTPGQQSSTVAHKEWPVSSLRFDLVMGLFSMVFVSGLYLDGWAHAHGRVDTTFFTPWHVVLYTGYLVNVVVLIAVLLVNHVHGYPWKSSMPSGYGLSLVGVPLFALAGVGDLIWHTFFGFEMDLQAVLSPTHLLLASSGMLILSGPIRATLRRPALFVQGRFSSRLAQRWKTLLPLLLSLTALLSVFTFFTEFAHPYVNTWTVTTFSTAGQELGVASILLQAGLLMGMIFLVIRRWRLPLGALTLVLTVNCCLMSVLADEYRLIPAILLAGIIADLLLWWLRPSTTQSAALRLFAFLVPLLLYLCYFITLMLTDNSITWSIHLWLGASVMAGGAGLVLSYLLVSPQGGATHAENL